MNRTEKAEVIEGIKEKFLKANAAFISEYRGMTVDQISKLRNDVRNGNGELKVVKNRLARLATKGTQFESLAPEFKGPLVVAFSYGDPVPVAKALRDNLTETSPLNIKIGNLQGKSLDAKGIEALSKLPDRKTLLGQMLSVIQAPLQNFANVLNAVPQGFVNAMVQLRDQKEKQA